MCKGGMWKFISGQGKSITPCWKMVRVAANNSTVCSRKPKRKTKSARRRQSSEDEAKDSQVAEWLKWGLFLLCFGAFLVNSHQNFSKFMASTKMVSESLWWDTDGTLPLPAMTLCRPKPPAGDDSISDDDLQIEDLLKCTSIDSEKGCMQVVKQVSDYEKNAYINFSDHKVTYTRFRGKCFTITIKFKVSPLSFLILALKPNPLLIYLHEPKEEFFIHWSWFPNKIPAYLHVKDDYDFIFASITKSEMENGEGCKPWDLDRQIDCLSENIGKDYLASGPNCTTPWLNSILKPNSFDLPPCKTYAELSQDHDSIDGSMAKHMAKTCPVPCSQAIYDLSVEHFSNPSDIYYASETGKYKEIYIDYSNTAVKKLKSVPISSVNDFVANIGGNLGLFLDFSLISLLYALASKFYRGGKRVRRARMVGR